MRAFIILCLVAVASAQLGYNYQPTNVAPSYAEAPTGHAPSYAAHEAAQSVAAPSYAAPAEVEKEFFSYTANEGDFYEPASSEQIANSLKKNLQVVFVKGPEQNNLEDAALSLAKQAAEQKTAIYVLNKLADIGDLANKLNTLGGNNNQKPEVHFVKYRTPEDAVHAQHAIQNQYDSLPGSSHSLNGGVASTLNFASRAPLPAASAPAPVAIAPAASAPAPSYNAEASIPTSSYIPPAPRDSYLPVSIFRTLRA